MLKPMKAHSGRGEIMPQPGDVAPFGPLAGVHSVVCAIGLILDDFFSPILLGSLFGGAIVALWRYNRESSFAEPYSAPSHSSKDVWKPEPQHLVPCGPYGGGQMTAHSIGLVIVVGLLLMGLVATPESSLLLLASAAGGAFVGLLLWLRHR
jgi:hypothetical protein